MPAAKPTHAKLGKLHNLGGRKGVTIEPARMSYCWRLVNREGQPIRHPITGHVTHTVDSAIWILAKMKDAGT